MAWSLAAAEQRRLVSALMELDGLRKRNTRDVIIHALERELGHPIPVTRQEQDVYDVWQLVDACMLYPGSVRALVSVLDAFHQGSRPMMEIRTLVDEMFPEPLLDGRTRRELHRLVAQLNGGAERGGPRADIARLYRDAVGPIGPALDQRDGDLSVVIAQLEEITADVEGIPPLLHFLERLAGHLDEAIAADVRTWVDGFAARQNIDPGKIVKIRDSAIPIMEKALPPAYLVIEFAPDGVDPDCFLLSAWLQNDNEPGQTLRRDDTPLELDQLQDRVAALLTEDHHVIHRMSPELTIEFVLPRRLLGHPFDQWRITIDGLERRLGIDHAVVVRSLDRLRQHVHHHNWRKKWTWLRENPAAAAPCRVTQPGEVTGQSPEGLYNTLLSQPSLVALALAFPPAPESPPVADELAVGLQAGVPVMAWCRGRCEPEDFEDEFRRVLDLGLLRLPDSVLLLRREALRLHGATAARGHLGFHLTLVFDDADRVPEPYVQLSPPL